MIQAYAWNLRIPRDRRFRRNAYHDNLQREMTLQNADFGFESDMVFAVHPSSRPLLSSYGAVPLYCTVPRSPRHAL